MSRAPTSTFDPDPAHDGLLGPAVKVNIGVGRNTFSIRNNIYLSKFEVVGGILEMT